MATRMGKRTCASRASTLLTRASNLQHIFPFFETQTSQVLLRQYRHWTRAYESNQPERDVCNERSRQMALNSLDVPGEAHEQVVRVEVHGRYVRGHAGASFAQIRPNFWAGWLECIHQTVEAENSFAGRCGYSPFQIAVGRDLELPGDLQDLPNVISSSFNSPRLRGGTHGSYLIQRKTGSLALQ